MPRMHMVLPKLDILHRPSELEDPKRKIKPPERVGWLWNLFPSSFQALRLVRLLVDDELTSRSLPNPPSQPLRESF
jgi:hypothetical protein